MIGTGAASTVFEAHDDELDAAVAVKVLADNWLNREDVVSAFLSEARLLRSIENPRIVAVHDIGTMSSGQPYLVMDLLPPSLGDRLDVSPPDPAAAVRVGRELCAALGPVHARGLLHRDVKPANVFVIPPADSSDTGVFPPGSTLVLGDFGLAGESGDSATGGTPGYMAPEQQHGGAMDARADVYSVAAVVRRVAGGSPTQEAGPAELRRAIRGGLAADPDRRPPDVQAFADLLAATRPRRRGVVVATAAVGLVVAVVVGLLLIRQPGSGGSAEPLAPSGDVPPALTLYGPRGVALYGDTVAIADTEQHRVLVVDRVDGSLVELIEGLRAPGDVAFDEAGTLFVADTGHHRVVRVDDGDLGVVAGTGVEGFGGDGDRATLALLATPLGIGFDLEGSLLIADTGNRRVRRVEDGRIDTVAGNGIAADSGDGGQARSAGLLAPVDVVGWRGGIAVTDRQANRVRFIDGAGEISTLAGTGSPRSDGDGGDASAASIRLPAGLAADLAGPLFVVDAGGAVRRIERSGLIDTERGGLAQPWGVAVGDGVVFVADRQEGLMSTLDEGTRLLGADPLGPHGDGGEAIEAPMGAPSAAVQLADGRVVVFDPGHRIIRFVDDGGEISSTFLPEELAAVTDLAVVDGQLLAADPALHRVVRLDLDIGSVTAIAGSGRPGDQGDGGVAVAALLRAPTGLVALGDGSVVIADADAHRVRFLRPDGVIETLAGTGIPGTALGPTPQESRLNTPVDVAVDSGGAIHVLEAGTGRIVRVADGRIEVVATGLDGGEHLQIIDDVIYVMAGSQILRHLGADEWEPLEAVGHFGGDLLEINGRLGVVDTCAGTVTAWADGVSRPIAGRRIPSCP